MPGNAGGNAEYADSTAVLSGSWGPNQTAQATVFVTTPPPSYAFEEVEVRLRTTITPNSITGYEINCSVSTDPQKSYMQLVRWNGPLGSFTVLKGVTAHAVSGDILKATINGSTITAYLNGNQMFQYNDSTFTSGSPGIGFYLQGATGVNANYGFSSLRYSD